MIYIFVISLAEDEHRVFQVEAENRALAECQIRSTLYEERGIWLPSAVFEEEV